MKLSPPILGFVLASAGVHAGLMMVSYKQTDIALPGSNGSVMSVKLKEYSHKKNQESHEKKETNNISSTVTQPHVKRSSTKSAKQETIQQAKVSTSQQENSASKARVVSLIYKELSNHFSYPRMAQKRNWQGQVLLVFHINSDGHIKDIKINHSSGYNVLDQAAIISLKKIGQLPQVSSWLFDGMEIQLPVIYQLTQG